MSWYVMSHPNPAQVEWMLQRENLGVFRRSDGSAEETLEYFIPFQFLLRAPVKDEPASATDDYSDRIVHDQLAIVDNGVREALHSYVFINADEQRVARLLESKWNSEGRLHLHHYRTVSGDPLIVQDDEMRRFVETLRNRQLRYYLGQPIDAMDVGDTVTLHIAPWEGRKATITRLELRGGRTKLTVTIDILGNLTRVTFPDVHDGDISFDDESVERLISGNLLLNFEQELLAILSRRFSRKPNEDDMRRDNSRLKRLFGYNSIIIKDIDEQRRFAALMLICASLLGEKEAKKNYVAQLEEWLDVHKEPATDTEAYLMLALFVALRKPVLRETVKNYRNTHDDCPDIIRQLFAKVKRIRCR